MKGLNKNYWRWVFLLLLGSCQPVQKQAPALATERSSDPSFRHISGDSSKIIAQIAQKDAMIKDTIQVERLVLDDYKINLKPLIESMQKGDSLKIICFGNSITRGYKVGTAASVKEPYPQVLQKLLRDKFKNPSIQVINEGHNGWRSDQALANIRTLVINQKPDLLILKLGINDVYSGFSPAIYRQNIAKMIEMLQSIHTQIILMNPTPILTPLNAKVLTYSPVLRNLAQEKEISFLNLYQKIIDKKENSELLWAEVLPDDVHFADNQYRWIAEILVEYLNVE